MAIDGNGNIFVADSRNQLVKEIVAVNGAVSSNSQVITIASGFNWPDAIALDVHGNLFVANAGSGTISEIVAVNGAVSSGSSVITVSSGFYGPMGIAVDASGNVFVGDTTSAAVKEIVAVNGAISTGSAVIAVGGSFSFPTGVAVDGSGNVFVTGTNDNSVKQIIAVSGVVSGGSSKKTVGSGFYGPMGVAVDQSDNVFVADTCHNAVKEIFAVSGVVSSSSTTLPVGGGFSSPMGVEVDGNGNIFVADTYNNAIKEVSQTAVNMGSVNVGATSPVFTVMFTFDTGGTIAAPAVLTQGAANKDFTDAGTGTCTTNGVSHSYSAGDTCTVDLKFTPTRPGQRLGAVQLASSGGAVIAAGGISGTGVAPMVTFPGSTRVNTLGSGVSLPLGVAVDGSGNIFVSDSGNSAVKEFLAAGGYTTVNTVGSGFVHPVDIAVDGSGNVFVADNYACCGVKEIVAVGGVVSGASTVNVVGSGFHNPSGVAVDAAGNVFVSDTNNELVKEIVAGTGGAASGTVTSASTIKTLPGSYYIPAGLAVDGSGNLFVADDYNNAVKEILAAGNYTTVDTIGSGFNHPSDVAVDASGNVYVSDSNNNSVKEILAGTGGAASGTVTSSSTVITLNSGFSLPNGVALDSNGNIVVADQGNNAVKQIDLSDAPSLSFASTESGTTSSDSPKTVTVANIGNAPLTFPVPATGNNPSISPNFTLNSSGDTACPPISGSAGSLAPGTTCTLPISFAPTTFGTMSGSLTLTDNNLNASSPNYAGQSIALSGTGTGATVILSSSPGVSSVNHPVTLTAAVTGGLGTPTQMVTFKSNGTAISDCPPVPLDGAGIAMCITSALPAGTDRLTADYSGDLSYHAKTSNTVTQTVSALSATLGVTASPSSSTSVDDTVTFTAKLAGIALTPVVPSGSITFTVNGKANADCPTKTVTATGSATCTTASLTAGTDTVTATYSGDPNFVVAAQGVATQTVDKTYSTTVLESTPDTRHNWTVNQPVILKATVVYWNGIAYVPFSGTVAFTTYGGGLPGCNTPVAVNATTGIATCTVTSMTAGSRSIRAAYRGDANYYDSDSADLPASVDRAATTTTVTSSNASSSVNSPVTFTATVAPNPVPSLANELAISGSVAFYADGSGTPITGCGTQAATYNSSTGQATATCTAAALSASLSGSAHAIVATYAGDSNYNGSDNASSPLSQKVAALAATLGVTASPSNSTNVDDTVTFTAKLAGVALTPVVPSGSITFTVNGKANADCPSKTVSATGSATCTTASLTAGTGTVTAAYSGDSNFVVASPGVATQTVAKSSCSVVLNSTPDRENHWKVNQPLILKVIVNSSAFTTHVPFSGSATVIDYYSSLPGCSSPMAVDPATGVATCTVTKLPAGNYNLSARYGSDTNYEGNDSSTLGNDVDRSATTTTVTSSTSGLSSVNDAVTFTATVAPSPVPGLANELTISGSVSFYADGSGTPMSDCSAQALSYDPSTGNGTASCTTSSLEAAGSPHMIVAKYAGDSNYVGSDNASKPISQAVTPLALTIGVKASPSSPANVNDPVTFTAQLAGAAMTPVVPSGMVAFKVNGSPVSDCPAQRVNASGSASCLIKSLPAGSDAISASYSGDGNYTVAVAGTASQTVAALTPTLGIAASPSSSTFVNDAVTFTARLSGVPMTPVTPTGTVNFTVSGNTISGCASVQVDATGVAACPTSTLAPGSDPVSAAYSGDTNFIVAAAANMTQTVKAHTATAAANASVTYSTASQTLPLSASVTSASGTVNAGTVTFTLLNGGSVIGAPVTSGTVTAGGAGAVYTLPAGQSAGSYIVQAVYNEGGIFATSTDSSHSLTILKLTPSITWNTPGPITYGTTLSPTQLNASADTSGGFAYSPVAGVAPIAGSQTLQTTFTPNDSTDYNPATATVTLLVNRAVLTVTANSVSRTYGTANPTLTATLSGFVNNDNQSMVSGAASLATTATTSSPVGAYPITASQGSLAASNYTFAFAPGTLTIAKATPAINWTTPASVIYGTALSATQLNAASLVAGNFSYSPAAGKVLGAGMQPLSTTFTPTDKINYNSATATVNLTVNQATPAIVWAKPAAITYGTALSATQLKATSTTAGSFVYSPPLGTVLPAGLQTLSATLTPTDAVDYTDASATVLLTVNKAMQTITFKAPLTTATYGTAPVALTATATSGLAVSFSATGPAAVDGNSLIFTGAGTVVVTASQPGDSNHTAASAVSQTFTVNKGASRAVLAAFANSGVYGDSITLTATVTGAGSSPGGTVTFRNGTAPLGAGTLSGGVATLATTALPAGSNSVTASYAGDANYVASTSSAVGVTVSKAAQTISFTPPPPNLTYGASPLKLAASASSGLPVAFSVTGPATVGGNMLTITGAGTVAITANQVGNGNFSAAAPVSQSIVVSKATPAAILKSSSASATYGASVTLTATVTGSGAMPTGTVTFFNNATSIGTGTLNASGVATLTMSKLPVGAATLTASYGGDSRYTAVVSPPLTETVNKATPSVKLTSSASTAGFGSSVTLTATLTGAGVKPSGAVTFLIGAVTLGTGPVTLNSSGIATLALNSLPAGADSIKASYAGDDNYSPAISTAVTVTVSKASQTITFSVPASPVKYGVSPITLSATSSSGLAVTFKATGAATVNTNILTITGAGSVTVTASQTGSANYAAATSVSRTITVSKATPGISLSPLISPVTVGVSLSFTATLTGAGAAAPAGSVTFLDGATTLGTGTLASGVARFSTSKLAAGTHSITARYSGDTNYVAGASSAISVTINAVQN